MGEDEACKGFRNMARAEQNPAQASCRGSKGSQALDKQGSGIGMGKVVERCTRQQSSRKGGAKVDAENNLCGMENLADTGEGAAPTTGLAEENGAADAKRGHVQSMVLVARQCQAPWTPQE